MCKQVANQGKNCTQKRVVIMAKKDNKYNDLSVDELNKELKEKKEALFNLRFQKSLQQLDHPIMIRKMKKEIARIKTRINSVQ